MPVAVGLIADDLTGALDAAAPFAMRGLAVRVIADGARRPSGWAEDCDVVAINTASRHQSPTVAARAVDDAVRGLRAHRPRILFKKLDSTLRGQVVAEILAARAASGRPEAIIAPAMPAQGRTFVGGGVYVDNVPLGLTGFARDAVTAAPQRSIMDELSALAPDLVTRSARHIPPDGASGVDIWIVDSETNAELTEVAAWASKRADRAVMVGSAGLAAAIAAHVFGPKTPLPARPSTAGVRLHVIGSRTSVSRAQIDHLTAHDPTVRVLRAPAGRLSPAQIDLAAGDNRAVVIRAVDDEATQPPATVARALGASTAAFLAHHPVSLLVATGGDTIGAILAALGQSTLEPIGEVLPGIPISRLAGPAGQLTLVTKAGGFGGANLFTVLPKLLAEGASDAG